MLDTCGPRTAFGQMMHAMKHRGPEETFDDYCVRYARKTADDNQRHFRRLLHYLREQVILPAGRQQLSVGHPYQTTAFNCFVGGVIPDDTAGIFNAVTEGALTLRSGGGVGWDFSTLRPSGEPIRGLGAGAKSSGPVSFMNVWHAMCGTIMSAGERRGAMMGILRIDHPDILKFVRAKQDQRSLTNFNISVAVTDEFMAALECDGNYTLRFGDTTFGEVRAADVWSIIMEANWDWAEPGVIYIDRINRLNPLYYCETIFGTNPCAEQPLPPYGACLLGSINMVKMLRPQLPLQLASDSGRTMRRYDFDYELLDDAVDAAVRAFDAVIDRTTFPLPQQKAEAQAKRRMGVGPTGLANAIEIMGYPYGSADYLWMQDTILDRLNLQAYQTSVELAKEKGAFPLFDADKHCAGEFISNTLPAELRLDIRRYGLRNGLLTSIAPTGSISLDADNVSSGIEPVFAHRARRNIFTPEGQQQFEIIDYAVEFHGVEGRTANDVTGEEHVDVQCRAQRYVDSSISKTCNVAGQVGGEGPGVSFTAFKDLYLRAWHGGAKSCATFNLNGKRSGNMEAAPPVAMGEGMACFIDPETGARECG